MLLVTGSSCPSLRPSCWGRGPSRRQLVSVVVLDASAAAELVTRTTLGRRLRKLAPADASWWAPDHLYVEAGAAVRRMSLRGLIGTERADAAIAQLLALPITIVRSKRLLREAWAMRENVTIADAIYVVLALHLDGPLLTGDRRLAQAPNLGITVLHLSGARGDHAR
jgi:predicted nucleic acid-binding protein